jgi:hypothetical protein
MMRLRGGEELKGAKAATGAEAVDSVVALCTDYSGLVSGVKIGVGS